jgi:hypothetical protein
MLGQIVVGGRTGGFIAPFARKTLSCGFLLPLLPAGASPRPQASAGGALKFVGYDVRVLVACRDTVCVTFVHIHRQRLMPPMLAEVIDILSLKRFHRGGQGVVLRRVQEVRFQVVYCCLFSQQGHRLGPKLPRRWCLKVIRV